MFGSGPRIMALLKYFKHIKPSKGERIQIEIKLNRWVSIYALIVSKLYGKA